MIAIVTVLFIIKKNFLHRSSDNLIQTVQFAGENIQFDQYLHYYRNNKRIKTKKKFYPNFKLKNGKINNGLNREKMLGNTIK